MPPKDSIGGFLSQRDCELCWQIRGSAVTASFRIKRARLSLVRCFLLRENVRAQLRILAVSTTNCRVIHDVLPKTFGVLWPEINGHGLRCKGSHYSKGCELVVGHLVEQFTKNEDRVRDNGSTVDGVYTRGSFSERMVLVLATGTGTWESSARKYDGTG